MSPAIETVKLRARVKALTHALQNLLSETIADLFAEIRRLRLESEHDRETLEPLENAFEATGGDLIDEVLGLRAKVEQLTGQLNEEGGS